MFSHVGTVAPLTLTSSFVRFAITGFEVIVCWTGFVCSAWTSASKLSRKLNAK